MTADLEIPSVIWRHLRGIVERTYPHEACGVGIGPNETARVEQLIALPNVSKSSLRSTFAVAPLALLQVLRQTEERGQAHRVLFHSHPDGRAELSSADLHALLAHARPLFPGVQIWVVSVHHGVARHVRRYSLDDGRPQVVGAYGFD